MRPKRDFQTLFPDCLANGGMGKFSECKASDFYATKGDFEFIAAIH